MRQHEYAKIGRVMQTTHPELVQAILDTMKPELKDTTLIKPMYIDFCLSHTPNEDFIEKLIFISAILKLFCPSALLLNCRVTDRVCIILTEAMGYNFRQSISYYISQARVYIKNPTFKSRVELISQQLMEGALV